MATNYIAHHGIKGMKWGVRRTDEQLARDRTRLGFASTLAAESSKINKSIGGVRNTAATYNLDSMTDAELQAKINRMNLERSYKSALSENTASKGQAYVRDAIEIFGSAVAIASSAVGLAISLRQLRKGD